MSIIERPETTTTTIERRQVKRGAAWLDEHYSGWADEINLATLDMQYCTVCVFGQIVGAANYWKKIRGEGLDEIALGFHVMGDGGDYDKWDRLAEAWRDEITSRR